jgi:hypothetical protein
LVVFVAGLSLLTCAAKPRVEAPVVDLGNNTFSVTRQATNGFSRDVEKLKSEAQEDAAQYCAARGKQLKVVSLTSEKPLFSLGYASAKIVFKALEPGAVDAPDPAAVSNAPVAAHLSPTGDLYNDLLKLDDLRKRGILTEEEFQSEKKKALNRIP